MAALSIFSISGQISFEVLTLPLGRPEKDGRRVPIGDTVLSAVAFSLGVWRRRVVYLGIETAVSVVRLLRFRFAKIKLPTFVP